MTHNLSHIQLRPMEEADYPRVAELRNMVDPTPITPEELLRMHRAAPADSIRQRVVALDAQEQLVGYSIAAHYSWTPPGKFVITVNVERTQRGQGVGSSLYTSARQFAEEHGASLLASRVREEQSEGVQFAQRRGFTIHRHEFESTLDLASFDETRFQGVIEQVEASGIHFHSLAELGNTTESQKKLHEQIARFALDIPGIAEEPLPPFEQMRRMLYQSEEFRADAQMIALDGETWVGSAMLTYQPEKNSMYNAGSGVERAYRGRHIALALKLLSIRCARRYGAAYLRTNNDSDNAAILALNRKLGYVAQPGMYVMQCALRESTEITNIEQ